VYLTYIDESGKPDRTDSEKEFVLAALSINESAWKRIDKMLVDLKLKFFPDIDPDSFEFHTTDMMHRRGVFKSLSIETRLMIIESLLNIVSEAGCHISSVIMRKDELDNQDLDVGMFSMKLLFERLCRFHDRANSKNSEENEEYGILLIDSVNEKYDNKLRIKIRELCKKGSGRIKNRYLIEDPIFVDSKYRHLSQLADCVAYCIRRKHRGDLNNPKDGETFERFYEIIEKGVPNVKDAESRYFREKGVEVRGVGATIPPLSDRVAARDRT